MNLCRSKLFLPALLGTAMLVGLSSASASALALKDCGVVVGHEMGLWEFTAFPPNPGQVDKVLKSDLKFVKVSLRKLKDGVWVVNHDADTKIYPAPGEPENIQLNQITWAEVESLKARPGADIPIFRLEEYIERDQGRLCWMFSPKVTPDENLVNLFLKLNIQDRAVILTGGLSDVQFLASFPIEYRLNFAGRVGDQRAELEAFQPYLSRLWAMEVNPTKKAREMISLARQMGFRPYLDSMRYSWNYELFNSACEKVFEMGAEITQTNRPLDCIKKMGFKN